MSATTHTYSSDDCSVFCILFTVLRLVEFFGVDTDNYIARHDVEA